MDQQKPEYLRPALIAGAVAGVLSGLPIIKAGNCICCLWIVGGAAMAVKLLARNTPGILTSGDGAIVGALTGIVAAIVQSLVAIPFRSFDIEQARRMMDWLSGSGFEVPDNIGGMLESGSGFLSPGWFLLGLFISAAVLAIMGAIGGIIGVSLFARKAAPPASPAAPPTAPPGPPDAA